jgi:hypothetical protein
MSSSSIRSIVQGHEEEEEEEEEEATSFLI